MSDARFAARGRSVRRRRWLRIGLAVLVVILLATMAWLVWFSQVLAVRAVAVDGERTLDEKQIRDTADVRLDRPLVRTDLTAIKARVAQMERVEDVNVSRSWPHTVRITVVERKPVAWIMIGAEVRALDKFGIDYRTYDKAPRSLVEAKVTTTDVRKRQQTLEAVAAVVQLIESKDEVLRKQLQSVSAASKDSIELDLTSGRTVVWGSEADGKRKLAVLEPLLEIEASRYDVSAPDQPTTRK